MKINKIVEEIRKISNLEQLENKNLTKKFNNFKLYGRIKLNKILSLINEILKENAIEKKFNLNSNSKEIEIPKTKYSKLNTQIKIKDLLHFLADMLEE